jgi:hypothetical protein
MRLKHNAMKYKLLQDACATVTVKYQKNMKKKSSSELFMLKKHIPNAPFCNHNFTIFIFF